MASVNLNSKERRILIVSFYLAPSIMVGGKRFTFLSKILNRECSDLHILTLNEKYIPEKDNSLKACGTKHFTRMLPLYYSRNDAKIIKKIFLRIYKDYLCILDPYIGWIFPALYNGLKIINKNKINVIISTGPPFSAFVIGYFLSVITNTKIIFDYRDPWSNHNRRFCKLFGKSINRLFETISTNRASALVFCSEMMKNNFIDEFGIKNITRCHIIHNGFNTKKKISPLYLDISKIHIIYAGEIYGERKISLFANPLLTLLNKRIINRDNFCFHIFGKLKDQDKKVIQDYSLSEIIKEHPILPYSEILRYLKAADILILIVSNKMSYSISYKFFDYLSVKKPILSIAPENSAMADLMNKIDCGRWASINSEESILENLEKMLLEKKEYSFSGAEDYTWEKAGQKYLEAIDEVILS